MGAPSSTAVLFAAAFYDCVTHVLLQSFTSPPVLRVQSNAERRGSWVSIMPAANCRQETAPAILTARAEAAYIIYGGDGSVKSKTFRSAFMIFMTELVDQ